MSDITITVPVNDADLARRKTKEFFSQHDVQVSGDGFKSAKWAGKFRFIENPAPESIWLLEITITDRPWWAQQPVVEPEIKKFFLGV